MVSSKTISVFDTQIHFTLMPHKGTYQAKGESHFLQELRTARVMKVIAPSVPARIHTIYLVPEQKYSSPLVHCQMPPVLCDAVRDVDYLGWLVLPYTQLSRVSRAHSQPKVSVNLLVPHLPEESRRRSLLMQALAPSHQNGIVGSMVFVKRGEEPGASGCLCMDISGGAAKGEVCAGCDVLVE